VQRALLGSLGLSSGTTPLPLPTNTPLPTTTDDFADDHARMRRSKVGARAIRPDDGIAREDAAPPVIAGDVRALPRAVLRHGRAGRDEGAGRKK
jgi:hypothetical protein